MPMTKIFVLGFGSDHKGLETVLDAKNSQFAQSLSTRFMCDIESPVDSCSALNSAAGKLYTTFQFDDVNCDLLPLALYDLHYHQNLAEQEQELSTLTANSSDEVEILIFTFPLNQSGFAIAQLHDFISRIISAHPQQCVIFVGTKLDSIVAADQLQKQEEFNMQIRDHFPAFVSSENVFCCTADERNNGIALEPVYRYLRHYAFPELQQEEDLEIFDNAPNQSAISQILSPAYFFGESGPLAEDFGEDSLSESTNSGVFLPMVDDCALGG
jgi:hypothetical protein